MTAERLSSNLRPVFLASLAILLYLSSQQFSLPVPLPGGRYFYGAGFTGEVENQPVYVHGAPHPRIYLYAGESV